MTNTKQNVIPEKKKKKKVRFKESKKPRYLTEVRAAKDKL